MPTGPIDPASIPSRDELVAVVAEIAELDRDEVGPDSRLVIDLDLDSLAIAELLSRLVGELGARPEITGLNRAEWFSMTVNGLYQQSYMR